MAKITVFDFCRQIGAASDKIPVKERGTYAKTEEAHQPL